MDDLRSWLRKTTDLGQVDQVDDADWDLEIGCVTALNWHKPVYKALVSGGIRGYARGYRVLTSSASNAPLVALTFNLPKGFRGTELIEVVRPRLLEWRSSLDKYNYEYIKSGPVLVLSGKSIDLFKFPVPKCHKLDGGRCIGTGDAVITQDIDNWGSQPGHVQSDGT